MGYIYKVTNNINGKMYIGQTSRTIEIRWKEHLYDAFSKHNSKSASPLHQAILKYGENVFIIEQIEKCNNIDLDDRERYWIEYYNTYQNGYNADFGGRSNKGHPIYQYALDGTFIQGFETLGDAQASIGGKTIMLNSKHPERAIQGYLWSRDKVDKLDFEAHPKEKTVHQYSIDGDYIATFDSLTHAAQAVCGRNTGSLIGAVCRGDGCCAYGYRWSFDKVEHLHEIISPKHYKKVVRIIPSTGEEKIYPTIAMAAKDNNASAPNITEVCKGRMKTCKGYYWKYYDELITS